MVRVVTSHVLWSVGILLLVSGFVCVRCEMEKSWKVKSSPSSSADENILTSGPIQSKLDDESVRLDEEVQPNEEDSKQNLIESEADNVEHELSTASTTTARTTSGQQKPRLRSTYVGDKIPSILHLVRESAKAAPFIEDHEPDIQIDDFSADEADEEEVDSRLDEGSSTNESNKESYSEGIEMIENILEEVKSISDGEKPSEKEEQPNVANPEETKEYDFGPVLNMTIDEPNNIVNVKLNGKVIKEIFTGRGSGFGAGSKKIWKYAMPLFVLPFLIQSAIIPFMLTTVKLFLLKSFLAGKLAIFLLILGAFKNFTHKKEKELYVKDLPERRYEPYSGEWPYPYHSDGLAGRVN
ncbi:uncharacterized protein LOC131432861 [Malaya genurostris]|uniref:uncharacterized protein LOC131432861 n=1 Tax=Malaya genurostris TaxID=325434 RepID=UPI0026F3E6FA|nr:uncharacterized protein LOC131432861 [Malaya genurostris]